MIVKQVLNFTPHDVVVYNRAGTNVMYAYKSSGSARVQNTTEDAGMIFGSKIRKRVEVKICGLPEPQPNTVYIVSHIVAHLLAGKRNDLIVPDNELAIRDSNNQEVLGVRGFITYGDATFEISTAATFRTVYQTAPICKGADLVDINALYIYYKQIVQAGGEWPEIDEIKEWSKVTIDEIANRLCEKGKLSKNLSISEQNTIATNFLYSQSEVVLAQGRFYFVKNLRLDKEK